MKSSESVLICLLLSFMKKRSSHFQLGCSFQLMCGALIKLDKQLSSEGRSSTEYEVGSFLLTYCVTLPDDEKAILVSCD